jgi:DNA repair exonuclease SbcCD ATPase subunit
MSKRDSAELLLRETMRQYRAHGYEQEALQFSTSLMYLYADQPDRQTELKQLIEEFDSGSALFNEHHELPPSKRQFYYYKGKYYEGINRLDSAEYFYRKISGHNMPYVAMNPMYKGLLSVFAKRHIADSVAKYSKLYCETNDSSIAIKDQEITAQMAASYNYNNIQKEALANKSKAYRLLVMLVLSASLLVVLILAGAYGYNLYKKKRQEQIRAHAEELQQLKVEFADATESYEENLHELRLLEESRKKVIDIIQSELNGLSKEKETYKTKYAEAQRTIARINEEYKLNSTTLREENQELHRKIDELKSKEGISEHLAASVEFAKTEAVQQAKALAHDPLATMTSEQWHALVQAFGQHFPQLYSDLVCRDVTPSAMRVCVLTVIGLRTNEQSNLMGIQKQVVTNYKTALNNLLFGEKTSRTLNKNLASQYNAFIV